MSNFSKRFEKIEEEKKKLLLDYANELIKTLGLSSNDIEILDVTSHKRSAEWPWIPDDNIAFFFEAVIKLKNDKDREIADENYLYNLPDVTEASPDVFYPDYSPSIDEDVLSIDMYTLVDDVITANEDEFDEFDGEIEEKLNEGMEYLTRPIIVKKDYVYGNIHNINKNELDYWNSLGFVNGDEIIIPVGTKLKYEFNFGRQLIYRIEDSDYFVSFNNTDGYFEREFDEYFDIIDNPIIANEDEFDSYEGEIDEYLKEDYYTNLIGNSLDPKVTAVINNDNVSLKELEDARNIYLKERNKIPDDLNGLDIKYDRDKGRFYNKYRPFVDRCKEIYKKSTNKSFEDRKKDTICKGIDYVFPYGWKTCAVSDDPIVANEDEFDTFEGEIEEKLNESIPNNQPIPISLDLLSVEEAEKIPKDVLSIDLWWWLKTPGTNPSEVCTAVVKSDGSISKYGFNVNYSSGVVRPVLTVSNISPSAYELYKEYSLFGKNWVYIGDNKFLYNSPYNTLTFFDKRGKSNDYEKSNIKKLLNDKLRELPGYVDYEMVANEDEFDSYEGDLFESLYRKNTSTTLKNKILDCLDWFITMEMEFPKDKFLADSWEDLKDGVLMGIDDELETAEGIVEYFKPIISFNRHYNSDEGEEGVFADEIELYKELVRSLQDYLAKEGYDYDPDPPDTIANETEFSEYDGEIDESVKEDFSEDEIKAMQDKNKELLDISLSDIDDSSKKKSSFKFKRKKD